MLLGSEVRNVSFEVDGQEADDLSLVDLLLFSPETEEIAHLLDLVLHESSGNLCHLFAVIN